MGRAVWPEKKATVLAFAMKTDSESLGRVLQLTRNISVTIIFRNFAE
jgi:hypothetical protein